MTASWIICMTADWTTAWATVAIAFTSIVALIYAAFQLKQSRDIERVKHLVEFSQEFEQVPMTVYRKAVADKRAKGVECFFETQNILNFLETIGLLERRGYLNAEDVWNNFGYWMFNIYADFRDDIEQEQKDDPTYYEDFCRLVERIRKIEKKKGGTDDRPSKEEIKEFWQDEAETAAIGTPLRKRKTSKKKLKAGAPSAIP